MFLFFFFNDTATTEIYTLSLHDALPISPPAILVTQPSMFPNRVGWLSDSRPTGPPVSLSLPAHAPLPLDRKSTRLNSSHANISYAVFCLKKKKKQTYTTTRHQSDSRVTS